jgi:hypothetical protein
MRVHSRESGMMTIPVGAEAEGMVAGTQAVAVGLEAGMAAMAAGCIAEE